MATPAGPAQGADVIQILISFVPSKGAVQVNTNPPQVIQDKMFCYGLLESAKDAIRNFKPPAIQTAPKELIGELDRMKH